MWFLPFLVVGAIAVAIAKRSSSRKALPAPSQFPPGQLGPAQPVASGAPPNMPGPITVLGQFLQAGQTPPPTVLLCAVAEAQSIGRHDLASDIVNVFIVPVVRNAQMARGMMQPKGPYERGSCAVAPSPRYAADCRGYNPAAPFATPPAQTQSQAASAAPAAAPVITPSMTSMDDEIAALLNADPARFMDLVSNGKFPTPAAQPVPAAAAPAPAPAATESTPPPSPPPTMSVGQSIDLPSEASEAYHSMKDVAYQPHFAPGSPFDNIPDNAWNDFVSRLARESPQFVSSRHVGQYRQRRERLAELGIDPNTIANSPQAQRSALDADLVDAHHHGVASELFTQHVGRPIAVPGRERPEMITLSGVLGVIQCAGLEGAVGWLERSNDRRRYPHTTQAFLHTNGVF